MAPVHEPASRQTQVPCWKMVAESGTCSCCDTNPKDDQGEMVQAGEGARVADLARMITTHQIEQRFLSPFSAPEGSALNPKSPHFNVYAWLKAFSNVRFANGAGRVPHTIGVAYKGLNVHRYGSSADYQMTVGNALLKLPTQMYHRLFAKEKQRIYMLKDVEGLILPGEQLCVLGPPGSGCSTFLRTIAGEECGLRVDPAAKINYHGITPEEMALNFRGEAIYTAEEDAHSPMLSVGDTLYFAALARTPRGLPVDRVQYATKLRDAIMAIFGISHTMNTPVGNDFVRGVSGGERKRVTIAEAALSYAPLQCWDNSTRGLDSANTTEFCRILRMQSDVLGLTSCVAMYQAPQAAYDLFDKVTVLHEGRQIFFGPASDAKDYFQRMGFECPESQTTPDFLTTLLSSSEHTIRAGYENLVPRTAEGFANRWKESPERQRLREEVDRYMNDHPFHLDNLAQFSAIRDAEKAKHQRHKSPYTLSYWDQIRLCIWRDRRRLRNDPSVVLTMLTGNCFEALIVASIFYNLPDATSSFFPREVLLFMMVLLNAFSSILEIFTMYEKQSVVEKHKRYALYHPSAESIAAMIMDLPYKIANALIVNSTLYFMSHLRRDSGSVFFYFLLSFSMMMVMSMFFRFIGSLTRSIDQALAPASIILLVLIIYTGFIIPVEYMRGWASWIRWLNPVSYGFEAVMVNEFHGRSFPCSTFIPDYESIEAAHRMCSAKGAMPGADMVSGTDFVQKAYGYVNSHRWRNFCIILASTVFLALCHVVASEAVVRQLSTGTNLTFRRGQAHQVRVRQTQSDEERLEVALWHEKHDQEPNMAVNIKKPSSILHWENVCYEVKVKKEARQILHNVDGWAKPGNLTAIMGVSGAGKTTLLNVLGNRTTIGVVGGGIFVDGRKRDPSFLRKTGYVQQQDLHLQTSTVREALVFSALLRQPPEYSQAERLAYVDTVIELLNMKAYADAIIGRSGQGLNVEQRKRLSIGVEVVARPSLLLLDEPTSGLDSQTSWSICSLLETLAKNGLAVLCTIHQPSAMLFQRFDRLLLLDRRGRTVYFGDIGSASQTVTGYFARNGGPERPKARNPAEYLLEIVGATRGLHRAIDWQAVWQRSPEYRAVCDELRQLQGLADCQAHLCNGNDRWSNAKFAAPFSVQLLQVGRRVFQQFWRSPSYIYSKALLSIGSSLLIGLSFWKADNTMQGLQNQMFGIFMFLFVVNQLILQMIPFFAAQRTLYESREKQSQMYSWQVFIISNIAIEFFWNTIMALFCFLVWFYPVGFDQNAASTDTVHSRSTLAFLIIWATFLFASSFAHMLIAGISSPEIASSLSNILSILMYAFCGILASPDALPSFWRFMYRVNPFTYLVAGFLATCVGDAPMHCADNEILYFHSPANISCADYMQDYISTHGGILLESVADSCSFCPMGNTDHFLRTVNVDFNERWRNLGLLWAYISFNIGVTFCSYWLFRVPKRNNH